MFKRTFFQHLWWDLWHVFAAWPKTEALFQICSLTDVLLRGQAASKHGCGLGAPIRCFRSLLGFHRWQRGLAQTVPSHAWLQTERTSASWIDRFAFTAPPVRLTDCCSFCRIQRLLLLFSFYLFSLEVLELLQLGIYCLDDVLIDIPWVAQLSSSKSCANTLQNKLFNLLKMQIKKE